MKTVRDTVGSNVTPIQSIVQDQEAGKVSTNDDTEGWEVAQPRRNKSRRHLPFSDLTKKKSSSPQNKIIISDMKLSHRRNNYINN